MYAIDAAASAEALARETGGENMIKQSGRAVLLALGHQPSLGRTPRDIKIDPSGRFLVVANTDSHSLVSFAINRETGVLEPVGLVQGVAAPSCLCFLPPRLPYHGTRL